MKSASTCVLEYYENKGHDITKKDIRSTNNRRLAIYDSREYWVGKREPSQRSENHGAYGMSPKMLESYKDGNCLWRI
jgi:hypothetical protein